MRTSTASCRPSASRWARRVRFLAALLTGSAVLGWVAAPAARAQDAKPAKPSVWTCTRPEVAPTSSDASPRDVRDHALRVRLRAIECELDGRRRIAPDGNESCYFGPEYARISNARYEEIRQTHLTDPVELWHALLSEPEDPNLPPIEIRVTSKSGPNCQSDRDLKLEAEANAIQKELNFR